MQKKAIKAENDKEGGKNEKRDSLPKQSSDKNSKEDKMLPETASSGSRKAYDR